MKDTSLPCKRNPTHEDDKNKSLPPPMTEASKIEATEDNDEVRHGDLGDERPEVSGLQRAALQQCREPRLKEISRWSIFESLIGIFAEF